MKEKDPNEFCKNICKGYKQTGKCIFDNRCEAYKTYEKDFIGIDIPFGAKDSEMKGWTYTIPEGFEAEIKDGKVIVREKESEDERVRKELVKYFKRYTGGDPVSIKFPEWIAWLEKQGEKKTADKVEPKFHEGEWLCENEPNNYARFIQILETVNVQGKERYRISRDIHNDEDIVRFDFVEKYYHKFDIKDAKEGDVLAYDKSKCIAMFLKIENVSFKDICFIGAIDHKFYSGGWHDIEDAHPATKEQRDLLFQKMKEAGYEWDAEKKELKKLEPKCDTCINDKGCVTCDDGDQWEGKLTWSEEDEKMCQNILECLRNGWRKLPADILKYESWFKSLKDRVQPKSKQEWSEEDKEHLESVVRRTEVYGGYNLFGKVKEDFEWLKDLPNRIQLQPQQEWSEKDENMLNSIIDEVMPAGECPDYPNEEERKYYYDGQEKVDWLKSLRPQNTWKPSDSPNPDLTEMLVPRGYHWKPTEEQMEYLAKAIKTLSEEGDGMTANVLYELRSNLKKLK